MNRFKRFFILCAVVVFSFGLVTAALAAADYSQQTASSAGELDSPAKIRTTALEKKSLPLAGWPPGFWPAVQAPPQTRTPSGAGDWDGNGVRYPMIIQDGGTYKMWFTGNQLYEPGRVGYATSPDGITWTKDPGNPILDAGAPGDWDENGLEAPFVIQEGPTSYKMWYSGFGFDDCAIGYATSSDGISWTKYAGNPVLTPGGDVWNNVCALHPFILFEGGVYKMWLLAIGDDGSGGISYMAYATSLDGIAWTWDVSNPLFGTTWEDGFWRPDVLHQGGAYQMWYSLWDGEGRTSYATAPDEVTWTTLGSPVLSGTPGEWDEGFAADPFVIENGGVYTMWYDDGTAIGVVTSTNGITWTKFLTGPVLLPGDAGLYLDVNYAHDWVEGWTRQGESFVVTVTDGANIYTVTGQTDGSGWFGTHQWPWTPYQPNITPGNIVQASAGGGATEINPIGTINGDLDFFADTVSGTIDASWFSPETLTVRCEVWVENGPPGIDVEGVPADGGSYACDFSTVGWDLQPGQQVAVRYYELDGDSVINIFEAPWMRVNYYHDWVGGDYELGHTFWLTVTDNVGGVKATAQIDTQSGLGWYGGEGFQTDWWNWSPSQPNIQSNDWVYFQADDGYFNTMLVGEISGTVDVDNDSVGGPVYANWLTKTLPIECHPWGAWGAGLINAPALYSSAEPDGSAPYFCQWDPVTEWDILPGQDIGVMYIEPDLDRVINVFRDPAPDLSVEKWAEGSAQSMPGGPVVYTIRFVNYGDAPATTIYLTDTLPVSTTYLTDSSGVTPTLGPGWVAWTLGPLDPGQEVRFQLVLLNTANPGDNLHNVVDISTQYDFNYGNNHAEADAWVTDDYPNLYVNKNPVPGDPTPGQTMLWEINYGNTGPVASGPVTLTDTLPLSTTVVSWYSENGYNLWTDVSVNGNQLVLTAPTLPGNWGDRILLRIQLDPNIAVGTQLTNLIGIATPNDTDPNDNWHVRDDVWVGNPRWDGYVNKTFNWATLIPGGHVNYNFHVRNFGNMAAHFWVTDTLPVGTSFAYALDASGFPFPPDYVDGEIAYWDLGVLEPGAWVNFNVLLDINDTTISGTVLTNCASITIDGNENTPWDNESCVTNTVQDPGPNLEITKSSWWNWEGQIHYEVRLSNIGTTTQYSVTITDTLPVGTVFNGNWWHNWSPNEVQFTDLGDQLVWTLNTIEPTANWYLSFDLDLNGNLIGVPGLAYTNTIEVPLPDDVYPLDNQATARNVTGPDIYVDKWLSGGTPLPGEIITFTIEFGNQNQWPWGADGPALLLDTLPPEMTFITATDPNDPSQTWLPTILPGNVLTWGWGDLCPGCSWQFKVVVQITDANTTWKTLPNTVEISSLNSTGHDLEWDYGNNSVTVYVINAQPTFEIYLPIVKNE